jgi:uncharacterized integral membrane protein (TIGR00697 family)
MVSQALDTGVFITMAFWGTVVTETIINMLISQYLIKLVIAVSDTPFCYFLVSFLRRKVRQSSTVSAKE